MTFPEFLTYCKMKNIVSVKMPKDGRYVLSIQTPLDNTGLYLRYEVFCGEPIILSGMFYNYSDYTIDVSRAYKITMPEIEKVFFPDGLS